MKKIVLVACVSRKGTSKAKAKDLYKGPLFTYSMAYAQSLNPDKIFILSALHHVLDLDKEIEPYDVTLSNVRPKQREKKPALQILTKDEAKIWGQIVLRQLNEVADLQKDTFIVLAGQSYLDPIRKGMLNIEEPLKGLKQGERVQFLAKKAANKMTTLTFRLHELFNTQKRFLFPFIESEIPKNGIYIIFEKGESFDNVQRIVRVGTHTGDNQLCPRLKQHFVKENKNRSIFRKNIGRCILNKDKSNYLPLWELDITSKAEKEKNLRLLNLDFEKQVERRISDYVQNNLSFCVFNVETKEQRLFWESKIISTLAKSNELKPSGNWLGQHSTKEKIKATGLWQVNELFNEALTEQEFEMLQKMILG